MPLARTAGRTLADIISNLTNTRVYKGVRGIAGLFGFGRMLDTATSAVEYGTAKATMEAAQNTIRNVTTSMSG